MKHGIRWFLMGILSAAVAGAADDYDTLKKSLQERSPKIFALKQDNLIMEGPRGNLLGTDRLDLAQRELVQRENIERERMFAVIAARTGRSPDEVSAAFTTLVAKAATGTPQPATPNP